MKRMMKLVTGAVVLVLAAQMALTCAAVSSSSPAEQGEGDIILTHTSEKAFSDQLYATDATGAYAGYRQLHGYPGEDKFAVYFTGGKSGSTFSFQATYDDLRGLDLNQQITWSYDHVTYVNTRLQLYNLMSDTARLSSMLSISDMGIFSQDWYQATFGQVYSDWRMGRSFSDDATRLAKKFLENEAGIVPVDRFAMARIRIDPSEFEYAESDDDDDDDWGGSGYAGGGYADDDEDDD